MKKVVRKAVFETNSSSVHSISIVPEKIYNLFKTGQLLWDRDKKVLVELSSIPQLEPSTICGVCGKQFNEGDNFCSSCGERIDMEYRIKVLTDSKYNSYDNFGVSNGRSYETFEHKHTTELGETLVAFGYYGSDY